jgi:hypothetical protein
MDDFAGWPVWGWLSLVVFLASIGVPSETQKSDRSAETSQ